jgi:hypothetical protein
LHALLLFFLYLIFTGKSTFTWQVVHLGHTVVAALGSSLGSSSGVAVAAVLVAVVVVASVVAEAQVAGKLFYISMNS